MSVLPRVHETQFSLSLIHYFSRLPSCRDGAGCRARPGPPARRDPARPPRAPGPRTGELRWRPRAPPPPRTCPGERESRGERLEQDPTQHPSIHNQHDPIPKTNPTVAYTKHWCATQKFVPSRLRFGASCSPDPRGAREVDAARALLLLARELPPRGGPGAAAQRRARDAAVRRRAGDRLARGSALLRVPAGRYQMRSACCMALRGVCRVSIPFLKSSSLTPDKRGQAVMRYVPCMPGGSGRRSEARCN